MPGVPRALVTLFVLATAPAAHAESAPDRERTIRILLIAGGISTYAASELLVKDQLAPDQCRWCGGNSFDDGVRDALVWSDTELAKDLSNLTGYVVAPLSAPALLLIASCEARSQRWAVYVDDLIPVFEAATYGQLMTNLVKYGFGRQRPFARFAQGREPENDDNLSFFSGHSSFTFSIAFAAGAVAHRRGYRYEPVIWATGISLAATSSYLRIAADKHYASDVFVGTGIGIIAGLGLPRLTGSLPEGTSLAPTANGVALLGTF